MAVSRQAELHCKSFAFVIGINEYERIDAPLISAVPDAERLAWVLAEEQSFDHVLLLKNARGAEIRALLHWLKNGSWPVIEKSGRFRNILKRAKAPESNPDHRLIWYGKQAEDPVIDKEKDHLLFYYAGHGIAGEFGSGPSGWLVPANARNQSVHSNNTSLIPMEELYEALQAVNCQHTLTILDCCFAGKFRYVGQNSRLVRLPFMSTVSQERFERFKRAKAWQVLASAGPHQEAADWMGLRQDNEEEENGSIHSPFAKALFDALAGEAEVKPHGQGFGDGVITAHELYLYLWNQVEEVTRQHQSFDPQYPSLFPLAEDEGGQFIFFHPRHPLNLPAERRHRNPYVGLRAFEPEDSDLFYGRRLVINEIRDKLLSKSILVITGPSASGKSSLVKAGVFPKLQKDQGFEEMLVLQPGANPWSGGQVALRKNTTEMEAEELETGEAEIEKVVWTGLEELVNTKLDPNKKQILLIDQYEALFTEEEDANDSQRFADEKKWFEDKLIELLDDPWKENLRIILTLRSDFEWQLEASEFGQAFWNPEAIYDFLFRLPPMDLDELREALINPAAVEAVEFDSDDLVDIILQEVSYAPGALTLLSFTMSELFRITDKNTRVFTFDNYMSELGGVNGALSSRADTIYLDELPDEAHRRTMRNIILRMIRLNDGEYTRRRVPLLESTETINDQSNLLHELDFPDDADDQRVTLVLDQLEKAQLLIRGREESHAQQLYIEPAHDSLVRFWPQSLKWIQEFRKENLLLQRQLWQATTENKNYLNSLTSEQNGAEISETPDNDNTLGKSTSFWDTNPKLVQVLKAALDPREKYLKDQGEEVVIALAPLIWEGESYDEQNAHFQKLFGSPDESAEPEAISAAERRADFLAHIDRWFNQLELAFIRASMEKREGRLAELKRRLEETIRQRNRAEAKTRESLANGIAFQAENAASRNHGFRLAEYANSVDPGNPKALQQLIDHYYFSTEPTYTTMVGHDGVAWSAKFSPDGSKVIVASGNIIIWDTQTGAMIQTISRGKASACYAPDGKTIAFATYANQQAGTQEHDIQIMDMENPDNSFVLDGHVGRIIALSFSPDADGTYLVSASVDGSPSLKLWNLKTKQLVFEKRTPSNSIFSAAGFSPDGTMVMGCTDSDHSQVIVWNIEDGAQVFETGVFHRGSACFFDNDHVLSVGHDDQLRLWNIRNNNGNTIATNPYPETGLFERVTSFNKHGKRWIAVSLGREGLLYDFNDMRQPIMRLQGHGDDTRILDLDFSRDGKRIVSAAGDITARLWDLEVQDVSHLPFPGISEGNTILLRATFSSNGEEILTISDDHKVRIYEFNPEKMSAPRVFEHGGALHFAALSSDGQKLATAGKDGQVLLWNARNATRLDTPPIVTDGEATFVRFMRNDTMVLSASGNGEIKTSDTVTGELKWTLTGHSHRVNYADVSPDGKHLISASDDTFVRVWDLPERDSVQTINPTMELAPNISAPKTIRFSPDGTKFVVTGFRRLKVYDFIERIDRFSFDHGNTIYCAVFTPDSSRVVSTSTDRHVNVLDLAREQLIVSMRRIDYGPNWVDVHPVMSKILITKNNGGRLQSLDPNEVIEEAHRKLRLSQFTPEEIQIFELENSFNYAGILNEEDNLEPLIEENDEEKLINYGFYFSISAKRTGNPETQDRYFQKARAAWEAAKKISRIFPEERYDSLLRGLH